VHSYSSYPFTTPNLQWISAVSALSVHSTLLCLYMFLCAKYINTLNNSHTHTHTYKHFYL
jgi:hypothetical protein